MSPKAKVQISHIPHMGNKDILLIASFEKFLELSLKGTIPPKYHAEINMRSITNYFSIYKHT